MEFPEPIRRICEDADRKYQNDIEKATAYAVQRAKKLKNFDELVGVLIQHSITEIIYDIRHASSVRIRNSTGDYGGPAKVSVGSSPSVNAAMESVYNYRIAGSTLGMIQGEQLISIADSEAAIAEGHQFNSRLCYQLSRLVPEGKSVKECVTERKLKSIFKQLKNQVGSGAA